MDGKAGVSFWASGHSRHAGTGGDARFGWVVIIPAVSVARQMLPDCLRFISYSKLKPVPKIAIV